MFEPIEASTPIESLLTAIAVNQGAAEGMRAMMQRESDFPSPLAAKLTGIALDPSGRLVADQVLDAYWSDQARQQDTLNQASTDREVIIGGGFHAAVYAATRVRSGYPKPLVLERNQPVGGTFAMTARPTFYLNSRNRPGNPGLAGDQRASLNYLPGALIQAANVSMTEYQTNTDLAFVIRVTLAQFADVVTNANVVSVASDGPGVEIQIRGRGPLRAGRIIDARGLGDPTSQDLANGTTILTFGQFMARMAGCGPYGVCAGSRSSAAATQPNAPSSRSSASHRNRSWPPPRSTTSNASTGTPTNCQPPAKTGSNKSAAATRPSAATCARTASGHDA